MGFDVNMPSQADVVQNGHPFEKLNFLERTGDPQLRALVWLQESDLPAFEEDLPLLGMVEPVEAVQANGLSRAVGAYERKNLPFADFQADSPQGLHAAEGNVNILGF
jgi:hypothetical protein